MATERIVATLAELPPGRMKQVEVGGERVVLYNAGGEIYASPDACPHKGAPLSAGEFFDGVVICPLHAWEFDVRTGECLSLPEVCSLQRYEARVDGELVTVVMSGE